MNKFIGARCIPIYAGEYDVSKAYEPLSIVTKGGNSYLSKKYVPIGMGVDNEEYWVRTGVYNQQLAEVLDKITALENRDAVMPYMVTPQMFGAVGDGKTDDTAAFKLLIAHANDTGAIIRIPKGRYVVSDVLGELKDGHIQGDYECLDYQKGSFIIDKRTPQLGGDVNTVLLKLTGKYTLEKIGFYGCDEIKNCIEFAGGWDSHVSQVAFYGYRNIAMKVTGMDITFNECFIMTSGSYDADPAYTSRINYAIEMSNKANCVHFHNLHIEHCRFMLRMRDAYTNSFTNCKFEQSTWGVQANSEYPPINMYMTSNIMFNGCILAGIASGAYTDCSLTAPHFVRVHSIDNTRGTALTMNGTTLLAGLGSGGSVYTGTQAARLIQNDANTEIALNGCIFKYISEDKGIDIQNAILSGNMIEICNDGTNTKPIVAMNSLITGNRITKKQTTDQIISNGSVMDNNIILEP